MVQHINPQSDEGRVPTPAELIIVDVMSAVLSNVDVGVSDFVFDEHHDDEPPDETPVALLAFLRDKITKYGFSDDGLLALLREKGYHVESTNTSLTISIPQ